MICVDGNSAQRTTLIGQEIQDQLHQTKQAQTKTTPPEVKLKVRH